MAEWNNDKEWVLALVEKNTQALERHERVMSEIQMGFRAMQGDLHYMREAFDKDLGGIRETFEADVKRKAGFMRILEKVMITLVTIGVAAALSLTMRAWIASGVL